jgi:hypothetical protein
MKTLKNIMFIGLMVLCCNGNAQKNILVEDFKKSSVFKHYTIENIVTETIDYYSYTIEVFNFETNALSFEMNVRVEDELNSEDTYTILNDISFLDFNINYKVGGFDIALQFENVLNYKDNNFAIEPNLTDNNTIIFSHEANVLLTASIVYSF